MKVLNSIIYITFFSSSVLLAQQLQKKFIVQSNRHTAVIALSRSDTLFELPHRYVISGSEQLLFDSTITLICGEHYRIDYRTGRISFLPSSKILFKDTLQHHLYVSYGILPFNFKDEYYLHKIELHEEPSGQKKSVIASTSTPIWSEDLFGPDLQKSGSIIRGFTVGSNRDLSLNSGFRLQLAGKLSRDVDVAAALTDENSPLQPEGTTQTLREVDKVYIEIKNPTYNATLGDFTLDIGPKEGGEFGQMSRKLLGAQGKATVDRMSSYDVGGTITITGATMRGKFNTNQFQGLDGVQGPYRLTGKNGEQQLIVIGGSEHVYLDGNLMVRGETNDYIIDYASGEVTFSSRRLITYASRITIDFEYSDRQYTRNLVAGVLSSEAVGNKLKMNISLKQEADDSDAPIDITLNESMKNILRSSGNDRYKGSYSGISFAGRDSITGNGRGQYSIRDTIIQGKTYAILFYAPGDPNALYSVVFSAVDHVPVDSAGYYRVGAGNFQFAGIGQGSYLPIQFLPMPQLYQQIDVNGEMNLTSDLTVSGEYAGSKFDANRFSTIDQNVQGGAFRFSTHYNPKKIVLGDINYGELDVSFFERFIDKNFSSPDRVNEVEFDRKWNLTSPATTDEEVREFAFSYSPTQAYKGIFTYGTLDRPKDEHSTRFQGKVTVHDTTMPSIQYQVEDIYSSSYSSLMDSRWIRQRGTSEYWIVGLLPALRVEMEKRTTVHNGLDSLQQGSFDFLEIAPRLGIPQFGRMSTSAELQIRNEDSAATGFLQHASTSVTQIYNWQLHEWKSLSSTWTLSLRNTQFTEAFKQRGNLNSDIILVRTQSRYSPFEHSIETDAYYEFSNQRSARLERVFIRVVKGTGNYIYLGDLNNNGVADENEFQLTRFDGDYIVTYIPGERLYPVADLKASLRLRLSPSRVFTDGTTMLFKVLRSVSTETYLRVDEKSADPDTKQIYLLNFNHYLDRQNTIQGSNQFRQDVFLFEGDPDLSFRLRYDQQNGLTQFITATERNHTIERSIRVQSQLVPEIGNQTDFTNTIDQVFATSPSPRERDLLANSIRSDFSYRPERDIEFGFVLRLSEIINRFNGQNATADINEQGLRGVYAIPTIGQLRGEVSREEVVLANLVIDPIRPLPFEFTEGKVVGKSFLWSLSFDYRVANNFQLSVNYDGRKEGAHIPIHTLKAEARAFF